MVFRRSSSNLIIQVQRWVIRGAEFQLIEIDRLGQELGSAVLTFGLDPAEFLPSLPARKASQ
jgi:hypothetical protein